MIVLKENINIQKCIHISDIHIRLSSRFEEYEYVFSLLYSELKKMKENAIIVITGDLFHHKNELTPDCILFCLTFLENLSKIYPTFIIPGNHDFLMNNRDKNDSITAILSKRDLIDLYYLKETNIYRYGNLLLCHYSLWDEKFINFEELKINTKENDISIALYHGIIGNHKYLQSTMDINIFNNYDYVMLGDIHKHQYMKPNIGYAGSLISQNFHEIDDYHGYILWDFIQKSSSFFKLKNIYAHQQIDIYSHNVYIYEKMTYENIEDIFLKLSQQVKLRILYHIQNDENKYHTMNIHIHQLCKKYKIHFPKIIYSNETKMCDTQLNANDTENDNHSLSVLLKKYLEIQNMSEYYDIIIKNNNFIDMKKNTHTWSILELHFDYLFGYGKNNSIYFRIYSL